MVDDTIHTLGIPLNQFVSAGSSFHTHAGKLAEESPGVSRENLVWLQQIFSAKTCAGEIKSHVRPLLV